MEKMIDEQAMAAYQTGYRMGQIFLDVVITTFVGGLILKHFTEKQAGFKPSYRMAATTEFLAVSGVLLTGYIFASISSLFWIPRIRLYILPILFMAVFFLRARVYKFFLQNKVHERMETKKAYKLALIMIIVLSITKVALFQTRLPPSSWLWFIDVKVPTPKLNK